MTLAELNQNLIDKLATMVDAVQDSVDPVKDISALSGAIAKLNASVKNKSLLEGDNQDAEEFDKKMDELVDRVGI